MNKLYDWQTWFTSNRVRLVRGVDFKCQVHSMVGQVRNAACRLGCKVSVTVDENTITIRPSGNHRPNKRQPNKRTVKHSKRNRRK